MCGERHVPKVDVDLLSILTRDRGNATGKLAKLKSISELCKIV